MQITLFSGTKDFKITKPIRLISLFSGYDSQLFSLKYLGTDVESWRTCEWAVKSIQALKDAHFNNDKTNYSENLNREELIDYLFNKGISADYNQPMTREQIKRLGEDRLRNIYNNIQATHNLVNIQQVNGEDLEINDTDKYCYVMTYSFPCQDLSSAGLGKGMAKGSETRSGMLWEVERILDEIHNNNKELPQVLLMENVPEVIGEKNIKSFASWLEKLESLGYHCYWKILNAKDYGIPQNRERCFMVSILGDYYYEFPQTIKLEKKLKDLLEDEVDEKYYLSDRAINGKNKICTTNLKTQLCNDLIANGKVKDGDVIRHSYSNSRMKKFYASNQENHDCSPTLDTRCDCLGIVVKSKNKRLKNLVSKMDLSQDNQFLDIYNQTTSENAGTITTRVDASNSTAVYTDYRIRKLTPRECFRLMGVKDEDFEKIAKNQSNASLYHLAGDSIVINVLMSIFREML